MERKYIPVFFDWIEVTAELSAEEKGRLVDALVLLARGEDWKSRVQGNERFVFPFLRSTRATPSSLSSCLRCSETTCCEK